MADLRPIALVYTTVPSEKWGRKIANALTAGRLAGCVVMFPARSTYRWKGKTVREKEHVLLIKAAKRGTGKLVAAILKMHPYEVPCIIELPVRANSAYARWLEKEG